MEKNSESESNSSGNRLNVSFKFTKKVSQTAPGNKLDDSNNQKDFVIHVDEKKIKSTGAPKDKEKDLVIPLIKKNNWRIPSSERTEKNDNQDAESKLNDLAVQELLKESKERNEQWENREYKNESLTIALVMQNKVPEGYETDEKMDVSLRPEESKLEDYERVPIEKFGVALLRGMGWKEGDPIGANCDKVVDPVQVNLRPKGLGLGADASALNKSKSKNPSEEKLQLVKDAYVRITSGKEEGFYGKVLGLDEENARVIVKLSGSDNNVSFPELSIEVVSKKEYEKESKVINRATYEKYKKEHEEREKSNSKSKKDSRKDKESSKDDRYARDERKRHHDSHKESNSEERQKHIKKSKSVDKSLDEGSYRDRDCKPWVRPQLRVRLIDDNYKKGKYFNEKVIVIDVLSPRNCTCKTDSGKYLEDISPSMLETVIPRSEPGYVMIVQGKYSGELCTILERNKSKCLATVQFLSDRNHAVELEYDSICEYVGDVSQYD